MSDLKLLIRDQLREHGNNVDAVTELVGVSRRYVELVLAEVKRESGVMTVDQQALTPSPATLLEKLIPPAITEVTRLRDSVLAALQQKVLEGQLEVGQLLDILDRTVKYEERLREIGTSASGTLAMREGAITQHNEYTVFIDKLRTEVPAEKLHEVSGTARSITIEGDFSHE